MLTIIFMYWGEQMKTVLKLLEEKLNILGYNYTIIKTVLNKFDLALVESKVTDEKDIENIIEVHEFEEPNVEIIELLLSIKYETFQVEVLEGDIAISSTETALGSRFVIADYSLYKRSAVIAITGDYKIRIIIFKPNTKTQNLYNGMTYEQIYKKERDEITKEYYEAFLKNGRVAERKIKEILNMLVSDYVIDEMAVLDESPRIKMYDNEYKYAENLYSYSLRYINTRTNRIEILNKKAGIRRIAKSVQAGLITNDPYLKIDEVPIGANFPLNTVSYYWVEYNKSNQEEIAIFVPAKTYNQATFAELKEEDSRIEEVTRDIIRRNRRERFYGNR